MGLDDAFSRSILHSFDKMGFNLDKNQASIYYHFLSKEDLDALRETLDKNALELSNEEIEQLRSYKEKLLLRKSFESFIDGKEISSQDRYKLTTYIMKNPIDKVIRDHMTEEELRNADLIIDKYIHVDSYDDVTEFINSTIDNYETSSLSDLFAAFFLDDTYCVRAKRRLEEYKRTR